MLFGFFGGGFFLAFLIVIVAVRWSGKGGKGEEEHKLVLQQRNHLGQFSVLLRGESRGERDYGTPVGWMDGRRKDGR